MSFTAYRTFVDIGDSIIAGIRRARLVRIPAVGYSSLDVDGSFRNNARIFDALLGREATGVRRASTLDSRPDDRL